MILQAKLNRPRWDALDISMLMEATLDGFACEFYGCSFDQLTDKQAKRILGAIAAHCIELGRACSPIPFTLTELGRKSAASTSRKKRTA